MIVFKPFIALMIGLLLCPALSHATTVPFTEDFNSDVANWADNSSLSLVNHVASGGPDGSAYASTDLALAGLGGESVVLFRGQDEFNSSGGAFEGNWIADGVGTFSAHVRHNAPLPLNFFTRFSSPGNHPGATAVRFAPVLPNIWTLVEFDIVPNNPAFVTFEGNDFETVFSNIGHVQVGVSGPEALDAVGAPFTFDLDGPSLTAIPEPASWILAMGLFAASLLGRRTRAGRQER